LGFSLAILDTDILVALLKGAPDATEKIRKLEEKSERVSTTVITAYELLKGASISSNPQENLMKVEDAISSLQVLDLSLKACKEASKIYGALRKTGSVIGEFDILIAAIARTYDETIITRDTHFKLIRGTKLIEW
jgi:tRNA(fMet)-specific endonuclease VapC